MTARVLVIDDNAANAQLLEARLLQDYYDVKTVIDGPEAINLSNEWQPDVILLDVVMPDMNGYQVCRAVKEAPSTSHIPVIMITGLEKQTDRSTGLRCGADEFLTKPVDYQLLLARLRGILRLKRALDEWRLRGDAASMLGLRIVQQNDVQCSSAQVLIVDDLPSRISSITDCLVNVGHHIQAATTESAALTLIGQTQFDLIMIGLSLFESDPMRLIARCRARSESRETPLLVLAEADERDMMIAALDLGANDCITLPLDTDELLLRVNNQIRRKFYEDTLRDDVDSALRLAVVDPLTQLYNRRYLTSHLERLCNGGSVASFAVFIIDIDHFKLINDQYGHAIGDQALKVVADSLRQNLRPSDLVVRYGGEEFVVVIGGLSDEPSALGIAEKLRHTVAAITVDETIHITASIGVSVSNPGTFGVRDTAEQLLRQADSALYEAKQTGRNRVVAYNQIGDESAVLRNAMPQ